MEIVFFILIGILFVILLMCLMSFVMGIFVYIGFDTFYKYCRKNGYNFSFVQNSSIDYSLMNEKK